MVFGRGSSANSSPRPSHSEFQRVSGNPEDMALVEDSVSSGEVEPTTMAVVEVEEDPQLEAALTNVELVESEHMRARRKRMGKIERNARWRMRVIAGLVGIVIPFVLIMAAVLPDHEWQSLNAFTYTGGAVAADNALCSKMGVDVLTRAGTNAVDAAVTTALCLGLRQPFASGIGGGTYINIALANGTRIVIDGRDAAPAAATADMFEADPSESVRGGKSVAVPGELAALHTAWSKYGGPAYKDSWEPLFTPVVAAARNGFSVGKLLSKRLQAYAANITDDKWAGLKGVFTNPVTGKVYTYQDIMKRPELADTLENVAQNGVDVFYKGSVAESIVAAVAQNGGILDVADLENYEAIEHEPVTTWYGGYEILGAPPSSSGGSTVAMIMNILQGYQLGRLGRIPVAFQYMVEAMKWAFSYRSHLGDPDFVQDVPDWVKVMTSNEEAGAVRLKISANYTHPVSYYSVTGEVLEDDGGTSHFSIMDGHGNVVSMTTSVNHPWGSFVLDPTTGVLLNNQMNDFTVVPNKTANEFGIPPSSANEIAGGKRPLSSMSPTIVLFNNEPFLAIGASGGPRIITSVVQGLVDVLDWGYNVQDAVDLPRFHEQWIPDAINVESNFPEDVVDYLRSVGQNITVNPESGPDPYMGNVQMVMRHREGPTGDVVYFTAASDFRKMGQPAGFNGVS